MDFYSALEEWRRVGGVIQVVGPDYQTFVVRDVEEGEDWRATCEFALAHSDLTEEEIEEELG
jgi:uncharacterized protein involved in tellurium resistance